MCAKAQVTLLEDRQYAVRSLLQDLDLYIYITTDNQGDIILFNYKSENFFI